MVLSDHIARLIEEMLEEGNGQAEVRRNDLAARIGCVPSQINYVLATRFSPDHGYITESRRGGGGYIRIVQVRRSAEDHLSYLLNERIGDSIDAPAAQILCRQLAESGTVPVQDAYLMAAAVSPGAFSVPMPEQVKNALRAKILRAMLLSIAQRRGE